jgi:hypothetical protein
MSDFDEKTALSQHLSDYNRKERQRRIRIIAEDMLSREALRNPNVTPDKVLTALRAGALTKTCLDLATAIYDGVQDLPIPDRT